MGSGAFRYISSESLLSPEHGDSQIKANGNCSKEPKLGSTLVDCVGRLLRDKKKRDMEGDNSIS